MENKQHRLLIRRITQYIGLMLVFALLGGGYWYWKTTRAAQTVESDAPSFEAPLTHSLDLSRGIGTPTYSRSDGADRRATVTDFEGRVIAVKSGEARFEGARRVENLTSYSENMTNGKSLQNGASASDADTVSFTADSLSRIENQQYALDATTLGRTFRFSVDLKGTAGEQVKIEIVDYTTWASTSVTVTLTAEYKRYTVMRTVVAGGTGVYYRVRNADANAKTFDTRNWQFEDVTGQGNQNPSEYVSTNVKTSSPYHGAGIDGVKYFDTQNGNTVASNIVTEAAGAKISQSTLKGYLAEGSRTNLMLRSEEFNDVNWVLTGNNATISTNAGIAPSGWTTAEKLVEDTATGRHQIYQNYTLSAVAYTASVYAKAGERTRFEIYVPGTNLKGVGFDLSSVTTFATTIAGVSAPTSSSIVAVGNGWYRCQMTWTATAEASNIRFALNNGTTADSYTGDGSSGLYLWGAQLEQATFASSYIPTTSGTVTRAADNLEYVGASNFNDTQGTVTVDVTTEWTGGSGFTAFFTDDSSVLQRMSVWHWTGASNHIGVDRNGGGGTRNNFDSSTTITAGTLMKFGQRWASTAHSIFVNGTLKGSDTTLTLPYDAISGIAVGVRGDAQVSEAYATIKNVRAWKKALTDTELNNLTSLTQATSDAAVKKTGISNVPSDLGLVGYWSFEDGSGTQAGDFSGNRNTGTLTNGPVWVSGKIGTAVNLDGSNDYIDAGNGSALGFTGNITISAWINPTSLSDYKFFLAKYNGGSDLGYDIGVMADGRLAATFRNGAHADGFSSAGLAQSGQWQHITVTQDASCHVRIYKNGVLDTTLTNQQCFSNPSNNLIIGTRTAGDGANFPGKIDEVRLYSRTLSASEIADLYAQGGTARTTVNANQNDQLTSGLVGYWPFNGKDLSGTTAYDRSGQGNNGTLTNGPVVIEGKVGQGLSFDGTDDYVVATQASAGLTQLAVSFWVNPDATPASQKGIFQWADTLSSSGPFILLTKESDGTSRLYVDGNYRVTTTITNGTWSHVTITLNSANLWTLYANGVVVGSWQDDVTHLNQGAGSVYLGNGYDGYFDGKMDEFRVYNRVLSQDEVTALYQMGR